MLELACAGEQIEVKCIALFIKTKDSHYVVNGKLKLNSRDSQRIPWPANQRSEPLLQRDSLPSLQSPPGTEGFFLLRLTPWPPFCPQCYSLFSGAGQNLVRGSCLLELCNAFSSSFHGLQDDHKLSIKELEVKYGTDIITVSLRGLGIGKTGPGTIQGTLQSCVLRVCGKVDGTFRMRREL